MDDITVCTDAANATAASQIVVAALARIGLKVNEDKSRILTNTVGTYALQSVSHEDPFIILGANVAASLTAIANYQTALIERQQKYFTVLQNTPLHPQIEFTLLRICGSPRLLYHVGVTEPEHIKDVTAFFDAEIRKRVSWLLDPSGNTSVPSNALHSSEGLGFPSYNFFKGEVFTATKRMALMDEPQAPRVSLLFDTQSTSTTRAQVDAQFFFFNRRNCLTPAQFMCALATRVNVIPPHMNLNNTKCNCGYIYTHVDEDTIEHILRCDMSTSYTHSLRHNLVRDTIATIARAYGIAVTSEPRCFTYTDGIKHRPDLLFHTQPFALATDVTMVHIDVDLATAEQNKRDIHAKPCEAANTIFTPFAMFTRGTLGTAAEQLIRQLSKAIEPALQKAFRQDLIHAVSVAAARGRASALLSAVDRRRL
jgi:hypothetical protein